MSLRCRDVNTVQAPWNMTILLRQYFQLLQSNNVEVTFNLGRIVQAVASNISVPANGLGTVPVSFALNATLSAHRRFHCDTILTIRCNAGVCAL